MLLLVAATCTGMAGCRAETEQSPSYYVPTPTSGYNQQDPDNSSGQGSDRVPAPGSDRFNPAPQPGCIPRSTWTVLTTEPNWARCH